VSRKQSSLSAIAILFSLTAATPPVVPFTVSPVVAQSTSTNGSFPLPKDVPSGTVVRVNGSSSMAKINEALAQKFKTQYSGTDVKVTYDGTDAALKGVLDGKSDLAAIGRPLTDGEKAKGLVATSVSRNKIAMFVGKDNPWKGELTINQFAQMFRGEVTDWSKVGGKAGKIRVIDRPDTSDTRKAFQNYPVFKQAPFKAGTNAVRLKEDSTNAVIKALGKDGIGYAIADQVVNNPNLRIVAMHKVAPTDSRYPFSQPLMYVYKGTKPSPAVQAFLGYATASENQQVVEKARAEAAKSNTTVVAPLNAPNQAEANNSSNSANSGNAGTSTSGQQNSPGNIATVPNTVANPTDSENQFPWWLLFIPLLGGLLWWVMKGLGSPTAAVAPGAVAGAAVVGAAKSRDSRIVLTPRNPNEGYAYWEIPEHVKEDLRREGKRGMKLRLYDVTDVDDVDSINLPNQNQTLVGEYNCQERETDLHVGIPASNRDYVAEIGYENSDDTWLQVARSEKVKVPEFVEKNVDTSEMPATSFADEEINEEQLQASSLWGDADVATVRPTSFIKTTPPSNPDLNIDQNIDQNIDRNLDSNAGANIFSGLAGTTTAVVGGAIGGASLLNFFGKNRKSEVGNQSIDESKVILVPRSAESAYAYWEISAATQQELQNQGGKKLGLRLYDTTDIDLETQPVEAIKEYECGADNDLHISIPACDKQSLTSRAYRDYLVELGYIKNDGNWLSVAHSEPVQVSSSMTELSGSNPQPKSQSKLSIEAVKVAANNVANNISNKTSDIARDTMNAPVNLVDRTTRGFSGWMGEAAKTVGTKLAGGAAAVAGVGTVTHAFFEKKGLSRNGGTVETLEVPKTTETVETVETNGYPRIIKKQCQIILVPRNFQDAYAYWEVSEDYKQAARNQGGSTFALRVHDATNLDIDIQQPHATQDFFCDENAFDKHIVIPICDKQSLTSRAYRDYIAEVGYYTPDNRWVRIIRSFHVRVNS
jgi:phosphate transport system substrate-binding protein